LSHKGALEMRSDDLMRASSPMLTRMLVDMLREGNVCMCACVLQR